MQCVYSPFHAVARTDVGKVRRRNEDAVLVAPACGLFAVSDGMGGASAGDLASRWVVEAIAGALQEEAAMPQGFRQYALAQGISAANQRILAYAKAQGYGSMGATVAACLVNPETPGEMLLCTMGDSRIYLLRAGVLHQVTRDHNLENEMAPGVQLKPDMLRLLTRAVGVCGKPNPQWLSLCVEAGERLFLCTDGVSGVLSPELLAQLLAQPRSLDEAADAVMAAVLETPARDNASFVIVEVPSPLPEGAQFPEALLAEAEVLSNLLEEV